MLKKKRYAVVNSKHIVENIIVADENFTLEGKTLINIDDVRCDIGDKYEDGTFISVELEAIIEPPTTEERLSAIEGLLLEII